LPGTNTLASSLFRNFENYGEKKVLQHWAKQLSGTPLLGRILAYYTRTKGLTVTNTLAYLFSVSMTEKKLHNTNIRVKKELHLIALSSSEANINLCQIL